MNINLENREYIKGAHNVKVCHQGQQFADRYSLYFPQTAFVWDIPTHSQNLWAVNRRYVRKYRQLNLHKERKPQEYFGLLHQSFTF